MKKLFTLIFLIHSGTGLLKAQLPTDYTDRLSHVFDSVCNKYHIKGASAAVLVPNMGTWTGVHGEAGAGTPVNSEHLFGIGSNTKTMIATLALRMQEMQLLSLNDTIGEWINHPNIDGQVTVRQLLNHTSGIYSYTDYDNFFDSVFEDLSRIWKLEEVLSMVQAPYFPRGTSWEYSNTNYALAGIILEKVGNKPLEQLLREFVFIPAGLSKSYYHPKETLSQVLASPWTMGVNGLYLYDLSTYPGYSSNSLFSMAGAAGAVIQTASDNARFWHKLLSGQIISNASLNEMKSTITLGNNAGYGLGIFKLRNSLNARTIYTHGGTNLGYINENAVDTVSGICFSVLTNQDSIDNNTLILRVIGALHKVSIQMKITEINELPASAQLQLYPNPSSGTLFISNPEAMPIGSLELYDMSGKKHTFYANPDGLDISFLAPGFYQVRIIDPNGMVIGRTKLVVK